MGDLVEDQRGQLDGIPAQRGGQQRIVEPAERGEGGRRAEVDVVALRGDSRLAALRAAPNRRSPCRGCGRPPGSARSPGRDSPRRGAVAPAAGCRDRRRRRWCRSPWPRGPSPAAYVAHLDHERRPAGAASRAPCGRCASRSRSARRPPGSGSPRSPPASGSAHRPTRRRRCRTRTTARRRDEEPHVMRLLPSHGSTLHPDEVHAAPDGARGVEGVIKVCARDRTSEPP